MKNLSYAPVTIIMGSQSDWPTMREATMPLQALGVEYACNVVSAHRTPERLSEFASSAAKNGVKVIIAGAGGAAHLPGMTAAMTAIPVLGVPVKSHFNDGLDSLLSIVQMPRGVSVGTLAVGGAGAFNAGLLAAQILSLSDVELASRIHDWRRQQTANVPVEVE